jgi:hypothetical protein
LPHDARTRGLRIRARPVRKEPLMLRKILMFTLTSGLALQLVRGLSRRKAERDALVDREAVRTWEDEGGAVKPADLPAPPTAPATAH